MPRTKRKSRKSRRSRRRYGGVVEKELWVSSRVPDSAIRDALAYLTEVPDIVRTIEDKGEYKAVRVLGALGALEDVMADNRSALLIGYRDEWLLDQVDRNHEPKNIRGPGNTRRHFAIQFSEDN